MLPLKLLWILSPELMGKEVGLQILILKRIPECAQLVSCWTQSHRTTKGILGWRVAPGSGQWEKVKLRAGHLQKVLNGHKRVTSLGAELMKCRNVMCVPNKELMSQVVPQLEQEQSQDSLKITLIVVEKKQQRSCGDPQEPQSSGGWGRMWISVPPGVGTLSALTAAAAIIWRPKLTFLEWHSRPPLCSSNAAITHPVKSFCYTIRRKQLLNI